MQSDTFDNTATGTSDGVSFAFFGTGEIAATLLRTIIARGMRPVLLITAPDRPAGRKQLLTPSKAKEVALEYGIPVMQPEKIDESFCAELSAKHFPVFVVVDYGVILPKRLLDIPEKGVVNMHPSLLPRLRGPSPIRSAILMDEKQTGVSLMLLDEKMDHGPLLGQRVVPIPEWPPRGRTLDSMLATAGAELMLEVLPKYMSGETSPYEQDHDKATLCHFITKEDGRLDLSADAYQNLLKIRAFEGWPGTFAMFERDSKEFRVQILDAHVEGKKLVIDTVKPEGKNEMPFAELIRSGARLADG